MKKKKKGRSPEDYAIMERMGGMIRRRRHDKIALEGRSQWTLTALGSRTGVSSQALGYIEKGKKWPGPALLVRVSNELGLNMDDLLRRHIFRGSQIDGDTAKVSGEQ
jgi:transcriptional regulator with XRE-family HTH domain